MSDQDVRGEGEACWRTTGLRRWLPVLLMASFLSNAISSTLRLASHGPGSLPRLGDVFFLSFSGLGLLACAALLVVTLRTRVTLGADGVVVRVVRTRAVAYRDVERAYRDRWSSGAVSLRMRDGSTRVLPAPVASLRSPGTDLDAAAATINARVREQAP